MTVESLEPVDEYLKKIKSGKAIKKIIVNIERLKETGHIQLMASKIVKKIRANEELFELRTIFNDKLYRIFFIIKNSSYLLIHAFDKKVGEKTPLREINTALSRIKQLN